MKQWPTNPDTWIMQESDVVQVPIPGSGPEDFIELSVARDGSVVVRCPRGGSLQIHPKAWNQVQIYRTKP